MAVSFTGYYVERQREEWVKSYNNAWTLLCSSQSEALQKKNDSSIGVFFYAMGMRELAKARRNVVYYGCVILWSFKVKVGSKNVSKLSSYCVSSMSTDSFQCSGDVAVSKRFSICLSILLFRSSLPGGDQPNHCTLDLMVGEWSEAKMMMILLLMLNTQLLWWWYSRVFESTFMRWHN